MVPPISIAIFFPPLSIFHFTLSHTVLSFSASLSAFEYCSPLFSLNGFSRIVCYDNLVTMMFFKDCLLWQPRNYDAFTTYSVSEHRHRSYQIKPLLNAQQQRAPKMLSQTSCYLVNAHSLMNQLRPPYLQDLHPKANNNPLNPISTISPHFPLYCLHTYTIFTQDTPPLPRYYRPTTLHRVPPLWQSTTTTCSSKSYHNQPIPPSISLPFPYPPPLPPSISTTLSPSSSGLQ